MPSFATYLYFIKYFVTIYKISLSALDFLLYEISSPKITKQKKEFKKINLFYCHVISGVFVAVAQFAAAAGSLCFAASCCSSNSFEHFMLEISVFYAFLKV